MQEGQGKYPSTVKQFGLTLRAESNTIAFKTSSRRNHPRTNEPNWGGSRFPKTMGIGTRVPTAVLSHLRVYPSQSRTGD